MAYSVFMNGLDDSGMDRQASSASQQLPAVPVPGLEPRQQPPQRRRQPVDPSLVEHVAKMVNSIGANLRILEERHSLMRNKSTVSEEGMVELQRSISKDLKSINDDITELKHSLKQVTDNLRLIDAEMKSLARKEEVKVLDRYLDFWQPLGFVTREELDRLTSKTKD
jgi:ElaB/YqjD/DUF883 family membrane-anchored ribosome-binding protein